MTIPNDEQRLKRLDREKRQQAYGPKYKAYLRTRERAKLKLLGKSSSGMWKLPELRLSDNHFFSIANCTFEEGRELGVELPESSCNASIVDALAVYLAMQGQRYGIPETSTLKGAKFLQSLSVDEINASISEDLTVLWIPPTTDGAPQLVPHSAPLEDLRILSGESMSMGVLIDIAIAIEVVFERVARLSE